LINDNAHILCNVTLCKKQKKKAKIVKGQIDESLPSPIPQVRQTGTFFGWILISRTFLLLKQNASPNLEFEFALI
jgi:hypothetical protein